MHSIFAEKQFWAAHLAVLTQAETMLIIWYSDILFGHLLVFKYVILCSFDGAI
jgi:hypothetical protein